MMCQQGCAGPLCRHRDGSTIARGARVWQAYLHLNRRLFAELEAGCCADPLSGADYQVLVPLSEAPGGVVRARELGTEIAWDRSRLSYHVSRLEKRGLVTRPE
jgi:DNA-binding MarR family transcriptional regulator